ncbi:hypothetical protein PVAND_012987 [Polypedilum vanderplanki]|uniref:C-type lectin domain-containing protein n=1 Tax=Polypedilum vanderplanki TaxID=319348 RepID=A0A9J6CN47_POLVA|nr:hypothetical protein PVAND_012987 [Polypedilum vanderplanki]
MHQNILKDHGEMLYLIAKHLIWSLLVQTYNELEAVRNMRMKFQSSVAEHILLSGMTDEPRSKNNWYWVHTGENISFNIPWQPTEPNNSDGVERCLQATLSNSIGFNDIECSGDFNYHYTFICQKIDFISPTCY